MRDPAAQAPLPKTHAPAHLEEGQRKVVAKAQLRRARGEAQRDNRLRAAKQVFFAEMGASRSRPLHAACGAT